MTLPGPDDPRLPLAARRARQPPAPRRASRLASETGQGSVELIALLPLVLILGVGISLLLAARATAGQAAAGAQAGAMALLQDQSPEEAARHALPPETQAAATIRITGRRVTVTVRPRRRWLLPDGFASTASADAGPEPDLARAGHGATR